MPASQVLAGPPCMLKVDAGIYAALVKLRTAFGSLLLLTLALAACSATSDPIGPVEAAAEVREPTEPSQPEPASTPEAVATAQPAATPQPVAEPSLISEVDLVAFDDNFATSIAPIFAQGCASCHNAGGPGAPHWQLETAGDLVATHEWIATVVDSRTMPPWPASDLSVTFHDDRSLRPDQIEAIAQWSAAGAPLDVDASTPISAPAGVIALDADAEVFPHESYQGSAETPDDYRCLIYDLSLSEPQWLQGFEFVPDQAQIVHHAIGYLAPGTSMQRARDLSAQDPIGGWQCYGGSGLQGGDDLFLGWAPGQLPTQFPEGSGILAQPGDFVVLQIHYHFDTSDTPADSSTLRLDWADDGETNLDRIEFDEFIGPAEIPCSADEVGPLCDRQAALAQAYGRYGIEGVLADGINQICGVEAEDFAKMTNGIASSSCTIPVRDFGEIVSVFGHEHEIGKSIRLTLNAGEPDEQVLLDIPDWDFDWQYNYYPTDSIMLERGDTVLLECAWDRSRRAPDLEPAYVLWADGTNDEMCFATISTRTTETSGSGESQVEPEIDVGGFDVDIPDELATCMRNGGARLDEVPPRDAIDATVTQLFQCAEPAEVGELLSGLIAENFGGLVNEAGIECISLAMATPEGARNLLTFIQPDATEAERTSIGEVVGDCVSLSAAILQFGFPLPDATHACIDEAGRDLLVQATIEGELPETQTLFAIINPCLSGG